MKGPLMGTFYLNFGLKKSAAPHKMVAWGIGLEKSPAKSGGWRCFAAGIDLNAGGASTHPDLKKSARARLCCTQGARAWPCWQKGMGVGVLCPTRTHNTA